MSVSLRDPRPQPLTLRRILVGLAATAAVLTIAGKADHQGATGSPLGGCAEDMACWDCNIHGNRVCGPTNEARP